MHLKMNIVTFIPVMALFFVLIIIIIINAENG